MVDSSFRRRSVVTYLLHVVATIPNSLGSKPTAEAPAQVKKAPSKIKPKACLFFQPQEFNEEKCATCFFLKSDHTNVIKDEKATSNVRFKFKATLICFQARPALEVDKKEACSEFTPQTFKPTHCATCFCPKGDHKGDGGKAAPTAAAKPEAKGTLFPRSPHLFPAHEEEKKACDDFEPQTFKPTHCATCFLPKTAHKQTSGAGQKSATASAHKEVHRLKNPKWLRIFSRYSPPFRRKRKKLVPTSNLSLSNLRTA